MAVDTHTHTPTTILVLITPHTLKRTHSSGKCGGFSFHAASRGRAEPAVTVGGGFILLQPLCDNNMDESNWGKCCHMEISRLENIYFWSDGPC